MTMEQALWTLLERFLNVAGKLVICVLFFQIGMKGFYPRYPFSGVKNGCYLFLILFAVYLFTRTILKQSLS